MEPVLLVPIKLYYCIINGGDGSVSLRWFLTEQKAVAEELEEKESDYGFCESATGTIDSYEGSYEHFLATR